MWKTKTVPSVLKKIFFLAWKIKERFPYVISWAMILIHYIHYGIFSLQAPARISFFQPWKWKNLMRLMSVQGKKRTLRMTCTIVTKWRPHPHNCMYYHVFSSFVHMLVPCKNYQLQIRPSQLAQILWLQSLQPMYHSRISCIIESLLQLISKYPSEPPEKGDWCRIATCFPFLIDIILLGLDKPQKPLALGHRTELACHSKHSACCYMASCSAGKTTGAELMITPNQDYISSDYANITACFLSTWVLVNLSEIFDFVEVILLS